MCLKHVMGLHGTQRMKYLKTFKCYVLTFCSFRGFLLGRCFISVWMLFLYNKFKKKKRKTQLYFLFFSFEYRNFIDYFIHLEKEHNIVFFFIFISNCPVLLRRHYLKMTCPSLSSKQFTKWKHDKWALGKIFWGKNGCSGLLVQKVLIMTMTAL